MEFVFVKKSRTYRKSLYYLVWGVICFQIILFILNLALIRRSSNVGLVIFNAVFLSIMTFVLYRHVLPRYKHKVDTADYEMFKIVNDTLIVKYDDEVKGYGFNNEQDHVTDIRYVPRITGTIDAVSRLSYNVDIRFSDGKNILALLSYKRAKELTDAIPNKEMVSKLIEQLNKDENYYNSSHKSKVGKIPSIVCFSVASLTLIYTLIILFGYNTTSGTYYATELMKTNPRAPINTYTYQVERSSYTNREDYTISFGDNLNEEITVFYRPNNPSDSYTMYTINFLMFITSTLVIIGGIMLNKKYSHLLALIGLGTMPFWLIGLLNISIKTMFSTHILIPVLSLLSIPMYLLLSGMLKMYTDISKLSKEKELS